MAKEKTTRREAERNKAGGFVIEELKGREAEEVFAKITISPDASTWCGKEATKELFKKVGWYPKWKVPVGDSCVYLPEVKYDFRHGDSRRIVGYVEAGGKVVARSFYQSKSQGVWRILPSYRGDNVKGELEWLHKLYGEDYLTLPSEAQKALATKVKEGGKGSEAEVDVAFFGTCKFIDPTKSYVIDRFNSPYHLDGNERGEDNEKIPPDGLDIKKEEEKPDFSREIDSWEENTHLYGKIKVSVFHSKNSKIRYTFCEEASGKVWIGGIELVNASLLDNGMRETWVERGDLTTPSYEYYDQAGEYKNNKDQKDFTYTDVYKNYLSHIPIIKEYKNMSEKNRGKAGAAEDKKGKERKDKTPTGTEKNSPEGDKPEKGAPPKPREKEVTPEEQLAVLREKMKGLKDKRLKMVRDNLERDLKQIEEDLKNDETKKNKAEEIKIKLIEAEESLEALLEQTGERKQTNKTDKKETKKEPTWSQVVDELDKRKLFGKEEQVKAVRQAIDAKESDSNIREAILQGLAQTIWEGAGKNRTDKENWQSAEKLLAEVRTSLSVVVSESASEEAATTKDAKNKNDEAASGEEEDETEKAEDKPKDKKGAEGESKDPKEGEGKGRTEKPAEQEKPEKTKEREFKMVDIPLSVINEIISTGERGPGLGQEVVNYILQGREEMALAVCKTLFNATRLTPKSQMELNMALQKAGYTSEEFKKAWQEKIHILVYNVLKGVADSEVKRRASDSIGLVDKLKTNWGGILKRVGVVAGVATGLAFALPAVIGLGTAATVGTTIGATGFIGRWWNKRVLKKEQKKLASGKTAIEEKTELLMQNRMAAERTKMTDELLASPQYDIAGQISQAIRQSTNPNPAVRNINAAALHLQLMWERAAEFAEVEEWGGEEAEAVEADKLQLEALLAELQKNRQSLPEAVKGDPRTQANIKGVTIKILEKIQGFKSGNLFSPEEKSKIKDALSYAAPVMFGAGVGTAMAFGGGAVWEGVRMALGGVAGGIMGYKAGEALDNRAQVKEKEKVLKGIMESVRTQLTTHSHGGSINLPTLQEDIDKLEGHLQIGSLSNSPKLQMNAEALLREGQRVLFERKDVTLRQLMAGLESHRVAAEQQAKDDLERIQKKTGNWRKWVGLAGGVLLGAAAIWHVGVMTHDGKSELLDKITGNRPGGTAGMESAALKTAHHWRHPTTSDYGPPVGGKGPGVVEAVATIRPRFNVADHYTIQKGDGLLNAANHFQADKGQLVEMVKGIRAGHPEWAGKSEGYVLRQWRLEQIRSEGYDFGDGWRSGTKTVHPGAEVKLIFDEKGYPHLSLGDEHVTEHGLRVEDLSPRVQNGTDTPEWPAKTRVNSGVFEEDRPLGINKTPFDPDAFKNSPHLKNEYGMVDAVGHKGGTSGHADSALTGRELTAGQDASADAGQVVSKEYISTRTQPASPDEPVEHKVADKTEVVEPEKDLQPPHEDVRTHAEDAFTKMQDFERFGNDRLPFDQRVDALVKALPAKGALEYNGVKYFSLDGGKTVQYEIPVGKGVLRGMVDRSTLPKLTEFQRLMEKGQESITDPSKFTAKLDKVMEDLGAKKTDVTLKEPPVPEVGGEKILKMTLADKEFTIPFHKFPDSDAKRMWEVMEIIEKTISPELKDRLAGRFIEATQDPADFDEFAKEFGK